MSSEAKSRGKEEVLAEKVVGWLHADDWEVYQEVQVHQQGACADIVATRGPLVMIVECKVARSLDLVDQLMGWNGYAHYVVGAAPEGGSRVFHLVLQAFGFGFISVPKHGLICSASYGKLCRRPFGVKLLRSRLAEEQKTWAKAGNAHGARFTPYAQTCRDVLREVNSSPGMDFGELMRRMKGKHHYASDSSARASLMKWMEMGKVKGVRLERQGRVVRVWPTGG